MEGSGETGGGGEVLSADGSAYKRQWTRKQIEGIQECSLWWGRRRRARHPLERTMSSTLQVTHGLSSEFAEWTRTRIIAAFPPGIFPAKMRTSQSKVLQQIEKFPESIVRMALRVLRGIEGSVDERLVHCKLY